MKPSKLLFTVPLLALLAASPLFGFPLSKVLNTPTTRPTAPVETFSAEDQPIDLRGATGQTADWLKAFDIKAGKFNYTLQLTDQNAYVSVYRLVYDSPFKSPFPENNVVPAELYLPRNARGKVPASIVLDIMAGNAILARGMSRGLAENGIAAVYVPMAYYNERRPKDMTHIKIFDTDPTRAVDALRQTVMDIRRAKAILASRAEIDPARISITGISLGGIMTSLAAGVDGSFYRVVPILAGGNIAELVFHTRETRKLSAELTARGVTVDDLAKMLAPVEPTHFASRIDPKRCLMINASSDEVIPRLATEALNKAIGSPEMLWAPSGHYSAIIYLPAIRQTAIRFLNGQPVDKIEY
ncbi:MAG TPA: alpha/beta hydrolase family protein [Tepidisphaeraceae bacterium]|jgi:dienelactone hydrolase|nr:alpha/beta hydrolase family protein [Tepidisphaeraceae bacterium]